MIALCLLLSHLAARADIVFFDMNNNPKEVEAARRAATARREKLIVLDAPGRSHGETLEAQFGKLAENNVKVSSIVISGHDGNGRFFGDRADMTANELGSALSRHPELSSGIRSLMLAGCYTGTLGAIEFNWRKVAPNLAVISGYDGSAPLGDKREGHLYMEDVLKSEPALLAATDEKKLKSAFRRLRGVRLINASLCVNGMLASTRHGTKSTAELIGKCQDLLSGDTLNQMQSRLSCYLASEEGCEDPPADTQRGELRQIYNRVHDSMHCNDILSETGQVMPNPDVIIRLTYFRNVAANLQRLHGEEIAKVNEALKIMGAEDALIPDPGSTSRAQLTARLRKAHTAFRNIKPEALTGPSGVMVASAEKHMREISHIARELHDECIPFVWVEPRATQRSDCIEPVQNPQRRVQALYTRVLDQMSVSRLRAERDRLEQAGLQDSDFMSQVDRRLRSPGRQPRR